MPKVKDETRYKRKFRANYPLWSECYEPAMGSGTGYPDIQVLSPLNNLLPIELKLGKLVEGRIFPSEVRPDQVVWHHNFSRAGGKAVLAIGYEEQIGSNKWHTFAVPGSEVIDWRAGYDVHRCFMAHLSVGADLVELVQYFLGEIHAQGLARDRVCVI
jgi:hypothetical protein